MGPIVVLYAGDSIDRSQVMERHPDWQIRPPIRRGDATALIGGGARPDIVAVVDGVFHQSLAVGHRELLRMIDSGVEVVGASSMGALRAVELCRYGMIGVGEIYRWYLQHPACGDDEVAATLTLAPDFRQVSEPLINIRFALRYLEDQRLLTRRERLYILRCERRRFYAERSYRRVAASLPKIIADADRVAAVRRFLESGHERLYQKRLDGRALVSWIEQRAGGGC